MLLLEIISVDMEDLIFITQLMYNTKKRQKETSFKLEIAMGKQQQILPHKYHNIDPNLCA